MQSFGRQAFWGVLLVAASLVATKLSALLAQFALGWLLTSNDYMLWGMLLSLRMFVDGFRNGGVVPVMQQRGTAALKQAAVYLKFGLVFNLISALVLIALIPLAEQYFRTGGLTWLIVLMAASFPLQTSATLHRTRLSIDLRFAAIARLVSISAVINYLVMVLLAALGMGPYSFVVPLIVTALVEWYLFGRAAGRLSYRVPLTYQAFRDILKASRWIMLSAGLASVVMMGDYLVIGRMAADLLGEYLFGFQLTVAFSTVVVAGFQQVLLPTFSRMQHDRHRLSQAFSRSITLTALVCAPCFAAVALLAPALVHVLWAGKWDGTIPVVQVMSVCLIFRLFNPLAVSALQAVARWEVYTKTLMLDAAAVVIAAAIGAASGSLTTLAIVMGIGRCVAVPILIAAAAAALGVSRRSLALALAGRIGLPLAGVLTVWLVVGFPGKCGSVDVVAGLLALLLTVPPMLWIYREDLRFLQKMLRRPDSPPAEPPAEPPTDA